MGWCAVRILAIEIGGTSVDWTMEETQRYARQTDDHVVAERMRLAESGSGVSRRSPTGFEVEA